MDKREDSGRHFVFHGTIVKKDKEHVTVRLFPGLQLDVRARDIDEIDEAVDDLTQRAYARIKLKEDAEIRANFTPRLARLAANAEGVPFAFGGHTEGARHVLPSGSLDPLMPVLDRNALAAFRSSLPPETWGALASAASRAMLSSSTTYSTQTSTDISTNASTTYDTVGRDPIDPDVVTHTVDSCGDSVSDGTKADGTVTDTKSDWL